MEIIGFEKQKKHFSQLVANGRTAHAYLFSGPEMIGKKAFALEVYKLFNKRAPVDSDADFRFIAPPAAQAKEDDADARTTIAIKDIRLLKSFMSLKPNVGPYKVVIIDDAHRMTDEASNALLKTLEEPPPHSVLLLISSQPGELPETILSRCQEVKFQPHSREAVEQVLSTQNPELSARDRDFIASLAHGQIGWAIQVIREDKIRDVKSAIAEFEKVLGQGIFEKLQFAKQIHEGKNYNERADLWLRWTYSALHEKPQLAKTAKGLLSFHAILANPSFNHRLALENFLLGLQP